MLWPLFSAVNIAVSKMSFLSCQADSHSLIPSVVPAYSWIKHTSLRWYRMYSMIGPWFRPEHYCSLLPSPHSAPVTSFILKGHLCLRSHCRHHLPRKLFLTSQVWVLLLSVPSASWDLHCPLFPPSSKTGCMGLGSHESIWYWLEGVRGVIVWVIN